MEKDPTPWINAFSHSHESLRALVEPLDAGQLERQSYASDWSIAQVLSHLGSQAEIFGLLLDAGLAGQAPPGRETFPPIWDEWNAKSPRAQADDSLRANGELSQRLEALDAEQRARLTVKMFGMDMDVTGLVRMRLGEHAVHSWDVAVALDPAATVAPDAVGLLVDSLDMVAGRYKSDGTRRRWLVITTEPERRFILETGDAVRLTAADADVDADAGELPTLRLPAEGLVRLVYGRLDPDHTSAVRTENGADLDELRSIFIGF